MNKRNLLSNINIIRDINKKIVNIILKSNNNNNNFKTYFFSYIAIIMEGNEYYFLRESKAPKGLLHPDVNIRKKIILDLNINKY